MYRQAIVAATFIAAFLAGAAPAAADDGAILVSDDRAVTLTSRDGGGATAAVVLANPGTSASPVTVGPGAGAAAGCGISASPAALEPRQQQTVTLTFTAACAIDRKQGTQVVVTAGTGSAFVLLANPPTEPSPDWRAVGVAYAGAAVLALVIVLISYRTWKPPASRQAGRSARMSLPGLATGWTFGESWATNATVVTALISGVFGAENVVVAILGRDGSTDLLAVALVSAAISVGLAGLSPMVLQLFRRWCEEQPEVMDDGQVIAGKTPRGMYFTPAGLVAAAVFTLTATGGQLVCLVRALTDTGFIAAPLLISVGVVAVLTLIVYAFVATRQNLTIGATLPAPTDQKNDDRAAEAADLLMMSSAARPGAALL